MSEFSNRWPASSARRAAMSDKPARLSYKEYNRRASSRRAWDKKEARLDRLAESLPDVNEMELDITEYLDSVQRTADQKVVAAYAAAPFPGGDNIAMMAEYWLYSKVAELYYEYVGHMFSVWSKIAGTFNHGQLAIYSQAYMEALSQHAEDARAGWPEDAEPEDYVNVVMSSYDYDVWARAFTETTDAPAVTMEAIKRQAEILMEMAQDLGFLDYAPRFPQMGKWQRIAGTDQWTPQIGRKVYVPFRVETM